MDFQHSYSRKHSSDYLRPIIGLIVIVCLIGIPVVYLRSRKIISPLPRDTHQSASVLSLFTKKKDPDELKAKVNAIIGNTWKNYSVLVVDYTSDFRMGINDRVIFTAASVNKVPIISALYYQAQNDDDILDHKITLQEDDIQDYGTGIIRYDPPGSTYSVKTLARLMMQKSDNTAAFLIANYVIGVDKVQSLMTSWGMVQTDIANNKTSNSDMSLLFQKIYNGKVANPALTQELFSFLKDSDYEDRLPALLPKGTTIYHKIGTSEGNVHDVGVVVLPRGAYYIGVMTSDITDEQEAATLSAKISKAVYEFMN